MQECEAELRQHKTLASHGEKMRVKEREASAAQPLEASQRAVIRDLSLKLAHLGRQLAASKADRSHVQVRGPWVSWLETLISLQQLAADADAMGCCMSHAACCMLHTALH